MEEIQSRAGTSDPRNLGTEMSLRDYMLPSPDYFVLPASDVKISAKEFELDPILMQFVKEKPFAGTKQENPYILIADVEMICCTFKHRGIPQDFYKWLLFPFSLTGQAKTWYLATVNSVKGNWVELVKKFCMRFYKEKIKSFAGILDHDVLLNVYTGGAMTLSAYMAHKANRYTLLKSDVKIDEEEFQLNPELIEMVKKEPFAGAEDENPYMHIPKIEMICHTFKHRCIPQDWFKWLLFPFSLTGEAKSWYFATVNSVEGNWVELIEKFYTRFFPLSRIQQLRRDVMNFTQLPKESIGDAWERYKELLTTGPDLGIKDDVIMYSFYMSLSTEHANHLNCASGGSFLSLELSRAKKVIMNIEFAESMQKTWDEEFPTHAAEGERSRTWY